MKPLKTLIVLAFLGVSITLLCGCKKEKEEVEEDNKPKAAVTDIDGNGYDTVTIGTQLWMVENLKVTKYNDGTPIPQNPVWMNLTTSAFCWYDNSPSSYKNPYGALYNWYAVNTGKLCPAGWHVPTNVEWAKLADFLGGASVAGEKLKETGILHWISPNTGATNLSGFSALPGGNCNYYGLFLDIGITGFWWSATEYDAAKALNRDIYYQKTNIYSNINNKVHGFSVRCIKDLELLSADPQSRLTKVVFH